jgi:hypothetical protein
MAFSGSSRRGSTIFTKGSNITSFTIYYEETKGNGKGGDIECEQITELLNSAPVRDINNISVNYATGQFEEIKTTLTQSTYNELSSKLFTLKRPTNLRYEKIRNIVSTNLQGLLQSINMYNNNVDLTNERNNYKTKADMLNDVDALIAHLNMLRGSISLFPEQTITVIPVEIKPEYLVYIKTYGYPEGGIWDPDLLGSILNSIQPATNVNTQ